MDHIAGNRCVWPLRCHRAPLHVRHMGIIAVETRPARGKFQPDYRDLFDAFEWYDRSPYVNAKPRNIMVALEELAQEIHDMFQDVADGFNAIAARISNKRKRDRESTDPPETTGRN